MSATLSRIQLLRQVRRRGLRYGERFVYTAKSGSWLQPRGWGGGAWPYWLRVSERSTVELLLGLDDPARARRKLLADAASLPPRAMSDDERRWHLKQVEEIESMQSSVLRAAALVGRSPR